MPIKEHFKEGQKIGTCFFIKETDDVNIKRRKAHFLCGFCGKEFITQITSVKIGHTISCGCKGSRATAHIRFSTHGQSRFKKRTSEWTAWRNVINRCNNPKVNGYKYYGGRGIKVCDRWLNSFENFFQDMGLKPTPQHSIERMDTNGNYDPLNCKWGTKEEQASNKSNSCLLFFNGETKTTAEWSRLFEIPHKTISHRLSRGWTVEQAIFLPSSQSKRITLKQLQNKSNLYA